MGRGEKMHDGFFAGFTVVGVLGAVFIVIAYGDYSLETILPVLLAAILFVAIMYAAGKLHEGP